MKLNYFKKHVAQWIEHQIPILKVGGSIPFMLIILYVINRESIIFCKDLVRD